MPQGGKYETGAPQAPSSREVPEPKGFLLQSGEKPGTGRYMQPLGEIFARDRHFNSLGYRRPGPVGVMCVPRQHA